MPEAPVAGEGEPTQGSLRLAHKVFMCHTHVACMHTQQPCAPVSLQTLKSPASLFIAVSPLEWQLQECRDHVYLCVSSAESRIGPTAGAQQTLAE